MHISPLGDVRHVGQCHVVQDTTPGTVIQRHQCGLCLIVQVHGPSYVRLISPAQLCNTHGVLACFWKGRQCKRVHFTGSGTGVSEFVRFLGNRCLDKLFAIGSYVQSLARVKRLKVEAPRTGIEAPCHICPYLRRSIR
jgi:hypothetical protein